MDLNDLNLQRVWSQGDYPVVMRGGLVRPVIVRLPYALTNRVWLRNAHRGKPEWLAADKSWSVPKTWFEDVLKRSLATYGAVYVIQPFSTVEK